MKGGQLHGFLGVGQTEFFSGTITTPKAPWVKGTANHRHDGFTICNQLCLEESKMLENLSAVPLFCGD